MKSNRSATVQKQKRSIKIQSEVQWEWHTCRQKQSQKRLFFSLIVQKNEYIAMKMLTFVAKKMYYNKLFYLRMGIIGEHQIQTKKNRRRLDYKIGDHTDCDHSCDNSCHSYFGYNFNKRKQLQAFNNNAELRAVYRGRHIFAGRLELAFGNVEYFCSYPTWR